jgi:ABC-type uncharacterized transport system involved in gliding motility auxiliary subunit
MERFRRFAKEYGFVLGYLAVAALLASAIRYILYRQTDTWLWGFLIGGVAAGVLFIAVWIWTRPAQVREVPGRVRGVLVRRSTRYGSNAILMSAVFLAILILLNVLGGRYHHIYDATELKQYSLSPQSVQVLAEINQPVTITGFFPGESSQRTDFDRLLNQYLTHSSQLSYTVIDPDREPIKASQYQNAPHTGLLIQSGDRSEVVYLPEEQDITSALLKVSRTEKKVIYFLTGHHERDMQGDADDGYSIIANSLQEQNYELRTLNLAVTTTVPSDAAVVVVAGPQSTLLPEEITRLQTYLAQGGKALIMQDPPIQYKNLDTGLNEVLSATWKVRFDGGVIVDLPSSLLGSEFYPVVSNYHYSQITRDMGGLATFFPIACAVQQTEQDTSGNLFFASLADTSAQSWAEQDTSSSNVQFNAGVDVQGPLTLVATVDSTSVMSDTGASVNTRMVLIGDSDFASNGFVKSLGNEVLFLNAVNWLAQEQSLIAIGPKSTEPRTVYLSRLQSTTILLVGVIVIPLALLVVGIVVWWVRR